MLLRDHVVIGCQWCSLYEHHITCLVKLHATRILCEKRFNSPALDIETSGNPPLDRRGEIQCIITIILSRVL